MSFTVRSITGPKAEGLLVFASGFSSAARTIANGSAIAMAAIEAITTTHLGRAVRFEATLTITRSRFSNRAGLAIESAIDAVAGATRSAVAISSTSLA
jgi:hypothetical protein